MRTIVLTGMMGAGKTTVGKLLAEKLKAEFYDIDLLIENREKISITDIFSIKGEEYFRKIEKEIILKIFKSSNLVLSLGGGAFEDSDIRNFLLNNSTVIYLKTSPENILTRIKNDTTRPLLCGNMTMEKINEIIEKRKKNYESAAFVILTDNKHPQQITKEITGVL